MSDRAAGIGVWLDVPCDWDELADIVRDAYRLVSSKEQLAQLDAAKARSPPTPEPLKVDFHSLFCLPRGRAFDRHRFASLTPAGVVSTLPLLLSLVLISVGIPVPTASG